MTETVARHRRRRDECACLLAESEEEWRLTFSALENELNAPFRSQRLWTKIKRGPDCAGKVPETDFASRRRRHLAVTLSVTFDIALSLETQRADWITLPRQGEIQQKKTIQLICNQLSLPAQGPLCLKTDGKLFKTAEYRAVKKLVHVKLEKVLKALNQGAPNWHTCSGGERNGGNILGVKKVKTIATR